MEKDKKGYGRRKQITFDLSQEALAKHYPRSPKTINPKFYKKAYADIGRFMKENGFEHRQFSVYVSTDRLTNIDISILMDNLAKEMPWLTLCVNQIDVTNIGVQHSLLKTLETATALHIAQANPEKEAKQKMSMQERIAAAQAEADLRNSPSAADLQQQPDKRRNLQTDHEK